MLSLETRDGVRLCDGLTRREVLRVGGFGLGSLGGLTLPGLIRAAKAGQHSGEAKPPGFGKAKSVTPPPPYVVPIRLNKVEFSEMAMSAPLQKFQPLTWKLKPANMISPTNGCANPESSVRL